MDFHVPVARVVVSCYFVNKDGQDGANMLRDYVVVLKRGRKPDDVFSAAASREQQTAFENAPSLAVARVQNFWGGVYIRFLVIDPGWYTIRVARNYSLNAILSGIFIDPVIETSALELDVPPPEDRVLPIPERREVDPLLDMTDGVAVMLGLNEDLDRCAYGVSDLGRRHF